MKKIIRTRWARVTEVTELPIDEELARLVNDDVLTNMIPEQKELFVPLTVENIEKIYMDEEFERTEEKFSIKAMNGKIYECSLAESVIDYINDIIWDCDYYTTDSEVDDWDTDIVDA